MQTAAQTNLFLTELSPLKFLEPKSRLVYGRFYQQIAPIITKGLSGKSALLEYADRLVAFADHAYVLRRTETVERVSRVLLSLPLADRYESVGRYYQALSIGRRGNVAEAMGLLEGVAEHGPPRFRAKAMMSLGAFSHRLRDFGPALQFFLEAGRVARHVDQFDPLLTYGTHKMIAALKGEDGDHRRSLDDLERIFPLARIAGRDYPPLLSDYLNSYAVELAAVGRIEEARKVSEIVLASPYSPRYPEWRETRDEIALKVRGASPAVVAFNRSVAETANVVRLRYAYSAKSNAATVSSASQAGEPARVIDFQQWTKKHMSISKEPSKAKFKRLTAEQLRELTPGQKRARLLKLIYDLQPDDEELRKMIAAIEDVLFEEEAQG